jgi:uncharacterized protein (TIGR02453 family)
MTSFTGFTPDAMQFLVDLALNNDRSWFRPRKAEYERLLKQPLEALCADLAIELDRRDVPLRADPEKSPFRLYRDTRFAKDKSPYKTHVAASFPWIGGGETWTVGTSERHGGGYFHLGPEGGFVGGGMWRPEPARVTAFRRAVVEDPVRTFEALQDPGFRARFEPIHGESLKRIPPGYPADHPHGDLLKLKDITFGREVPLEDVFSAELPRILADDLAAAVPVMRFLASLEVRP